MGEDLDLKKYIVDAIVVFNLDTKQMKWEVQLDQSSDNTIYQALIYFAPYFAPSVVDLVDLVDTSMGFAYVLDH